jgi:hypothetical protein
VRPYLGPSESQSNADALVRRGSPYSAASDVSFRIRWDVNRREVDNLRDAVRAVRRAYADEVPTKLHDGPDAIGDDGTPRMTARAVGYIFGDPEGDDAGRDPETGQRDLSGWHYSPFRANLAAMSRGSDTQRLYAAIVQAITIGGQDARQAALAAGVRPEAIAKGVALMALRSFLRSLSDLKLHLPREDAVA